MKAFLHALPPPEGGGSDCRKRSADLFRSGGWLRNVFAVRENAPRVRQSWTTRFPSVGCRPPESPASSSVVRFFDSLCRPLPGAAFHWGRSCSPGMPPPDLPALVEPSTRARLLEDLPKNEPWRQDEAPSSPQIPGHNAQAERHRLPHDLSCLSNGSLQVLAAKHTSGYYVSPLDLLDGFRGQRL